MSEPEALSPEALSPEAPPLETPAKEDSGPRPSSPYPVAPTGLLSRDSDKAVRPGFRSPANKGSKAQKADKKKK